MKTICKNILLLFFLLGGIGLIECKSTPKTIIIGETTFSGIELKQIADRFAAKITAYFFRENLQNTVFVALLATKNDTTEDIPIDVLDFGMINALLDDGILTVRTEDRGRALDEIEFNLSGLSDNTLTIGRMKTPNYFIKIKIKENYLRQGRDRISEFTVVMELRSVETQLVHASDIVQFTKRSNRGKDSYSW